MIEGRSELRWLSLGSAGFNAINDPRPEMKHNKCLVMLVKEMSKKKRSIEYRQPIPGALKDDRQLDWCVNLEDLNGAI